MASRQCGKNSSLDCARPVTVQHRGCGVATKKPHDVMRHGIRLGRRALEEKKPHPFHFVIVVNLTVAFPNSYCNNTNLASMGTLREILGAKPNLTTLHRVEHHGIILGSTQ